MKQKPNKSIVPKLKVLKQKHMKMENSINAPTSDLKKNKKTKNRLLLISLSSIFILSLATIGYSLWSANNNGETSLANLDTSTPDESSPSIGGGLIGGPIAASSSQEEESQESSQESSSENQEQESSEQQEESSSEEVSTEAQSEESEESTQQSSLAESLSEASTSTPIGFSSLDSESSSEETSQAIDDGGDITSEENISVDSIQAENTRIEEGDEDSEGSEGSDTNSSSSDQSSQIIVSVDSSSVAPITTDTVRSGGSSLVFSIVISILLISLGVYLMVKNAKSGLKLRK